MNILNVEMKARCTTPNRIRSILKDRQADFKGTDYQTDTYYEVKEGRLKLREGNIENNLIYYRRSNTKKPKTSDINLVPMDRPKIMKTLLANALGIKVVVDKQREIYFIDNVKFHIDEVKNLGCFIEIEAIDKDGTIGEEKLRKQCQHYMELFAISNDDLVAESYSNLILAQNN